MRHFRGYKFSLMPVSLAFMLELMKLIAHGEVYYQGEQVFQHVNTLFLGGACALLFLATRNVRSSLKDRDVSVMQGGLALRHSNCCRLPPG